MSRVLIVDDDEALREGMAEALSDLGHQPEQASNGEEALARIARGGIDAVLLDLRMPGIGGIEVLGRLRAMPSPPPVAVLTAVPTASNTIEAMRLGAVDHLAKPIGRDDLAALVTRMVPAPGSTPSATLAKSTGAPPDDGDMIGGSAAMRDVQKSIGMLADSEATVLITGETGTGKEVVARAIHRHGRRGAHPFVAVNCAAIPAELLESQLFGHMRGAFTGAVGTRVGSFQEANRGTLFLDEIGDMDLALQAKLLRVLQDRLVTPVGGRPTPVDVRILAATHQDLAARVADGLFREDLYYRLGVVPVRLPPLRDRLADIVPLAEFFLARATPGTPPKQLLPEAASLLLSHPWPGNVRELRNAMERASALSRAQRIGRAELGFLTVSDPIAHAEDDAPHDDDGDLPAAIARLEKAMITRAMIATGGNRADAARRLNIHRQLLYEKLRKYGLEASGKRTDDVRISSAFDGTIRKKPS